MAHPILRGRALGECLFHSLQIQELAGTAQVGTSGQPEQAPGMQAQQLQPSLCATTWGCGTLVTRTPIFLI